MHQAYQERETVLATAMEDRVGWERATRRQRQLAVAADAGLRRRHPGQPWPPLRSAEPGPRRDGQAFTRADAGETARRIEDLAARHREFARKLAERQSLMSPAGDPGFPDIAPAFPARAAPGKDAIIRPPKPRIQPPEQVLRQITGRDRGMEAAG